MKKEIEKCTNTVIHQEVIDEVSKKMPEEEDLYDLAELFKVFGDSTRMRIIAALLEEQMCVCDISCLLNMTQSAISHQLRILKNTNLVKATKVGKVVYYSLKDSHVGQIFHIGLEHIKEKQ
ncbi:metalloregulator ArsR/SmtB family transcription factor [Acetivibrio sp. MSJd-27]|jgi:transcriptional regulator, arsR family|uniref:ArsR/SmtB family transcription factor n=1 Tax=Acetivibrio sp. MSJd-27 TaxID=2841523 RepID=UPI0015ADBB67|nr:metalloregulator ArsR/SmtB family transcription factor [Acetivibrio sp. MSJd-27]MBU5450670.1 metalloregulator ArsR/SmtB family transcription factor [Acetivibrio sp. MSJd-27]